MELRDFFKNKHAIVESIEYMETGLELFESEGYPSTAHFEMVAHFSNNRDSQKISISRKYNDRFISLVKEIIKEEEDQLKE